MKSSRQIMWQSMRVMKRFSKQQLAMVSAANISTMNGFLQQLLNTGYVQKVTPQAFRGQPGYFAQYQLVKNTGPSAPVFRESENVLIDANTGERTTCLDIAPRTPINKATANRQRIWSLMRSQRRFTSGVVASVSGAAPDVVARFVYELKKGGYIKDVGRKPGKGHGETIYQLIKDTGPKAPRLIGGQMVDQNDGERSK